ncbi:Multidrug resistance protein B, MF superfamily [Weissella ceti]|uniref:Multidrug resistance protein B, MF superfamily n=2 Tax=Weissella TaxID=46255 RepID=A0A075U5N6_9LACO|nr:MULTISPECIES: MFS transporter [Weissella]AIG65427.1 Multidrug resistance protein B, MF superfamily [Weissella tructae]AIM62740.1 Multidrug resistance protein B, MF superfamily [Weissella ceti]AIM64076.1 Multidrug resistance protein B, MF superfamily [Weissella ceti]ELA07113.1 drug:H+ antiporter-2 (DHA2) family protein [Weissella ceti NC36]QVV91803.1 MFS transporter [Weissella tructae]
MNKKEWNVLGAVIAAGLMSFGGVLIETAMNVTFPHLMQEFNTDASGIQWVTTGYLLAIAIVVPISAYLIRNFSVRNLFLFAEGMFLIGLTMNAFSPDMTVLLTGRMLQGVGTGISIPLMFHIILTKAPLQKRGVMMGIGTMTTSIAPAIGPTYGGILLSTLGWRSIFWFLIIIVMVSLFIGLKSIPAETVKRDEKFNFVAFLTLALGLSMLLLAVEQMSATWLMISLVSLVGFYFANRKRMLLNLAIFKFRQFDMLMYSLLVYQAMFLGLSFILPNYLQMAMNATSTQAGLFMFPAAVIGTILAPVSGRLLDRIGAKGPITVGLTIATIATVLMAVFFQSMNFWVLMFAQMLMMVGIGLSYSNLMTTTLGSLPEELKGDGNSIVNTLLQFVAASATAIVAQILASAVENDAVNGVVVGAQEGVIFLATLIVISWCVFMVARRKIA